MNRLPRLPSAVLHFFPYVVMGLITLLSFSLLKSTSQAGSAGETKTASADIDYFTSGFSSSQYLQSGDLKLKVFGSAATHFVANDRLDVQNAQIWTNNAQMSYRFQANQAQLLSSSHQIILMGNVQIIARNRYHKDDAK